jgi:hypothetical protein
LLLKLQRRPSASAYSATNASTCRRRSSPISPSELVGHSVQHQQRHRFQRRRKILRDEAPMLLVERFQPGRKAGQVIPLPQILPHRPPDVGHLPAHHPPGHVRQMGGSAPPPAAAAWPPHPPPRPAAPPGDDQRLSRSPAPPLSSLVRSLVFPPCPTSVIFSGESNEYPHRLTGFIFSSRRTCRSPTASPTAGRWHSPA